MHRRCTHPGVHRRDPLLGRGEGGSTSPQRVRASKEARAAKRRRSRAHKRRLGVVVSTSIFVRRARRHGLLCSGWTSSPHNRPKPRRFSPGAASQDEHPTSIIHPATVVLNRKTGAQENAARSSVVQQKPWATLSTEYQQAGDLTVRHLTNVWAAPFRPACHWKWRGVLAGAHRWRSTVRRSGTLRHQRQIRNTLRGAC